MAGATAPAAFFGAWPGGSSPGGATESAASDFRSRRFSICSPEAVSEKRIGLGIPRRRGLMIL